MLPGRLAVELYAESGAYRGQEVAVLPFGLHRHHVGQERSRPVGLLLDAEVRAREVQLQAGRRGDRPQRVVDGELYVVCLTHGGDLLRLREAAGDTEVHAGVVDPFSLDELTELPLRAELLARGKGHGTAQPQHLVGSRVFGAQRVLDKERAHWLGLAAEEEGVGHVQAGVGVQDNLDVLADRLADRPELLKGGEDGAPGLEDLALLWEAPAYEPPSFLFRLQARLDQRARVHAVISVVRVADYPVAHPAAQEFVDRDAQSLALYVPQRDVRGRDRRGERVAGREEAAPEERLPGVLGAGWVLSDEQRLEVFDGPRHCQLAARDPRLADAGDALVGVYDHEEEVPLPAPHGIRLDVGDLHAGSSDVGGSGSSVKKNVAPLPTAPSAHTLPPWRSTTRCTVASPMPVPSNSSVPAGAELYPGAGLLLGELPGVVQEVPQRDPQDPGVAVHREAVGDHELHLPLRLVVLELRRDGLGERAQIHRLAAHLRARQLRELEQLVYQAAHA